ncbi:cysteine desulfurase family protein [Ignavigranum ruoffiae]|uniref:Cysteine desulfurase n=1 Tax=Ignavigranum ruoffiae TaxID=89093 RepID=A0A1H8YVJ7_9LACT|nr:cysteine desulfurase family protein [Ignavigranum ruoffiae]UPQ85366.1 cysteine desulfurase [Ignavigranum ruoffiae]SEP56091.1 cysteine desulfurase [Ignavigranum ruoffiae]
MIYLDYAATNPIRPEVIELIQHSLQEEYGNPSSIYQIGKKSKQKLRQAREEMAQLLGVSANEIYFTSGATEANNWALRQQAEQARQLGFGQHIVATAIEHPSVSEVLKHLEQDGFRVTYLKPNTAGNYTVNDFIAASSSDTIGWVAMAINNELGTRLPIKDLGLAAREHNIPWFHVDTVQMMGHLSTEDVAEYCTSFVGSAHKFAGPKGIGFLVYRPWDERMILKPLLFGGGQEAKLRSGTENLPYIRGMVHALSLSTKEQDQANKQAHTYSTYIVDTLTEQGILFEVNGVETDKVDHILNLWLPGREASQILIQLDLKDIYVSAGSACSAGSVSDSPVLQAYYPDQSDRWHQSIRISYGYQTTMEDIKTFTKILLEILERK